MAQQIHFAETIRSMKLAMKRRADDSDHSAADVPHRTNRGNKLMRRARYVQQDRLDDTGRLAYRQKVTHAGYTRHTISTNPPLFDDDGDLYSPASSDNENDDRYGQPIDENPFGEVQLENLLRPLTAAAELPTHPSLSIPYKSTAVTQMAEEALEMLRRERNNLWKAKHLLQRFRGDADWVPSATFETEHDDTLLNGEGNVGNQSAVPSIITDQLPLEFEPPAEPDVQMVDDVVKPAPVDHASLVDGESVRDAEAVDAMVVDALAKDEPAKAQETEPGEPANAPGTEVNGEIERPAASTGENVAPEQAPNPNVSDIAEREAASETASNSNGTNTHAMTTRARARSPAERSDRTPSPSPSDSASIPVVHPWFVAPSTSLSDRDLGLPVNEADDTRKLLLLYVQKQEQVVRSLDALYMGLQKTDRLRQYVYRSCKAEAHLVPDGKGNMVTEMSDGEDWYDISDWGLQPRELKDGQLEKGKDEVEDVEEEGRRRPGRGRRVNRI
ncbi:hypothetical protein M409DRAFT_30447 [Zasmidium cellare ATCC 36951]|uniref:Transcriptional regulatory protein RXT2 N-terminal domain-containing protein n=1 Tax=Zasmidium cellare ATCC 36951 TaxID=1080233 RepID=A0A6A6BZP1_ZASCE|nr:uncharacterized protein M409DRAFT_30447 [Zasmidium cellare ATCC 36951]KAF2159029.1 hypothetical protein M409DRAFT_30447 [Zasmidium cellare ATCC 36951]